MVGLAAWSVLTAASVEQLVIPGSGSPEYVLGQLAKVFNSQQSTHQVSVPTSTGIAGALRALDEGKANITRIGRPLTPEELGKGYTFQLLGRDAVVFVAGQGVSVRAVTSAQMLDVYRGTMTDWQALGGTPGPIRAIGRQPTATPRSALDRYIKGFGDMLYGANVKIVHLDPQTIALLDRYPTSLGFLNRSGLFAAKTNVVVLALDTVVPTPEAVHAGSYPVVLELGLAYKASALTEAGRAFLQFVTSPTAASVLRQYAVVPVAAQP